MNKPLTVGKLKEFLSNIPNETPVILEVEHLRQSALDVTWAELMGRGKVIMITTNNLNFCHDHNQLQLK
mgnify:CR=1 FL=1